MASNKKRVWLEGFHAGAELDSQLPYPDGTPEARAWLEGWVQGIHASGHSPAEPQSSRFEDSEFEDSIGADKGSEEPPPSRWRQFFKNLLG